MIKMLMPLPKKLIVACSGGVDSMAALDFLSRNHAVTAAYFDHRTESSVGSLQFVANYCKSRGIPLELGIINKDKPASKSLEEHWRDERYGWLDSLPGTIVTAHHLDDAVETWIWSSMHGNPRLPRIQRGNVLRPFLVTTKLELMDWCIRKNVPWHEDASNLDQRFMRNYIRHTAMPVARNINPGIHKTIKKKLTETVVDYIV